jgi:hypothetical protein
MKTRASVAVLSSWADGPAKQAVVEFVERASAAPADERLATFDNDGTLWTLVSIKNGWLTVFDGV